MTHIRHELISDPVALAGPERSDAAGGRYWVRTSDLFRVKEARYHCANRPDVRVDEPEVETGFEPVYTALQAVASPLGHSTAGQAARGQCLRADDGIRTRDPHLGKVMLYQLSHVRTTRPAARCDGNSIRARAGESNRLPRAAGVPLVAATTGPSRSARSAPGLSSRCPHPTRVVSDRTVVRRASGPTRAGTRAAGDEAIRTGAPPTGLRSRAPRPNDRGWPVRRHPSVVPVCRRHRSASGSTPRRWFFCRPGSG